MTGNGKMNRNSGAHTGWHDAAGRFVTGNPGKRLGTSKHKLREQIKSFVESKLDELPQWFGTLKPPQKLDAIISLLPYVVARLQSVSMTDSQGNDLEPRATINYTKLSQETLKEILANTIEVDEKA